MENSFNISYCSDKYQYTMGKTFFDKKMKDKIAVFNLFYRKAPDQNNWAVVSGISEAIKMIAGLGSESEEFFESFLPGDNYKEYRRYLSGMKFTGNVYAMKEGEIAFPLEPIITIEAPLIEAQVIETPLLSIMNHQMAVATKASRVTRATEKPVSEFGSRRAHGPWAAVYGGKAAYIGGCLNSSNILTSNIFNIDATGTMAHSYITSFGCSVKGELESFDTYIKSHYGEPLILLIDTYDTINCGLRNAIKAYKENGIDDSYSSNYGIRLDSGDLTYLSGICREELDKAGLKQCKIFATNSLDEYIICELERQNAQIDAYGVGDAIATSKHNPCFGNVYKLVELDNEPLLKRSEDKSKVINPGFQRTYRISKNGMFKADVTCLREDTLSKKIEDGLSFTIRDEFDDTKTTTFESHSYQFRILQNKIVKDGQITLPKTSLQDAREYFLKNLRSLNSTQTRLINPHFYKVDISDDLYTLKNKLINNLIKEIKDYATE
jgi:nicotinate phosphoribosyltransferase